MKKRWFIIAGIAAAGLVILAVLFAMSQPEAVPAIRLAQEDVVATLTVTGEVQADTAVNFSPPVTARILSIAVDEGDAFQPGQVLVQLDADPVRAELAESRARAAQAGASYADVLQGARPEQIEAQRARVRETNRRIQQIQASLVQAQSRLQNARRDARRFQDLYRQDVVSTQEFESAQLQADIAEQEVERVQAELSAARTQRAQAQAQLEEFVAGPTDPEVRQAAAASRAAQANVGQVQARLGDYRITSRMRGVVTERLQDPGDLATPNQPILRAVNPDSLEIILAVEESDMPKVHVGDRAYVILDALPEVALDARITRLGSRVNPENGTVEVRAVLVGDAWQKLSGVRLMPGMTADVNIITERLQNAMVLPATAVRTLNGQSTVYRFEGNTLQAVPVRARRISVENYLVLSGLKPGDWVVATAGDNVNTNKRVKPVPVEQVAAPARPPSGKMGGG